jgi:hypothetical protein
MSFAEPGEKKRDQKLKSKGIPTPTMSDFSIAQVTHTSTPD